MVHFIPCKRTTDAVRVAQLFFAKIYRFHGLPESIFSDRDTRFLSHFWRSLWKLMRTSLDMSTAYHPQSDGQTKVVNHSLGNMLRALIGDNIKAWESRLCQAEFAHNHAVNRSSGFSPFNVVYGVLPRCPLDLAPLPDQKCIHGSAADFVSSLQDVHRGLRRTWRSLRRSTRRVLIFGDENCSLLLAIWSGWCWQRTAFQHMSTTNCAPGKLAWFESWNRSMQMLTASSYQIISRQLMSSMLSTSLSTLVITTFKIQR